MSRPRGQAPGGHGAPRGGHGPPGLAVALLRALLPREGREVILGDLEECHARRVVKGGRRGADRWFWTQVAAVPLLLGLDRVRAYTERMRRGGMKGTMGDLVRDLRVAVRSAVARPAFSAVVVLTLGLAIAANTAMFGVVNLALFESLPLPDADRVVLGLTSWPGGQVGWNASGPDFRDVQEQAGSFESMAALTPWQAGATLTGEEGPERVTAAWASEDLFRTLGVTPVLGREFRREEADAGGPPVAMLTHALWLRRFGGSPDILGETLTVNGTSCTVVGILPPGFAFIAQPDVWLPMSLNGPSIGERQFHNWLVVGRLRPDVTLAGARAEVDGIMARLEQAYPESNRGMGMPLQGVREALTQSLRPTLTLLGAAVVLLLLVATGNVANLLLARGSTRATEMAVRTSLGAGRGRIVRMLVAENVVLALAAGVAGTALAVGLQRALIAATPMVRVGVTGDGVRPAVLAFGLGLSLATVLLFGVGPALASSGRDVAAQIRSGALGVVGRRRQGFRSALVVFQVALSTVILLGAGLLTRSFAALRSVDPGFDADDLFTAEIALPAGEYPDPASRQLFFDELVTRVRGLPGVGSAALASRLPIRNTGGNVAGWNPDAPPTDASAANLVYTRAVSPGYFETLGIPVHEGRGVTPDDVPGTSAVAVVNRTLAETLFPGEQAVGRTLALDRGSQGVGLVEIVGVVGDVRLDGLGNAPPMAAYMPFAQAPPATMRLAVRTTGTPDALVGSLRDVLRRMDPDVPLVAPGMMHVWIDRSVAFTRRVTQALGVFALVALFLASLGLYGVLAFQVAQRRREIGVRLALGADTAKVVRGVVANGFALVLIGVAVGLLAATRGVRLIQGMLFGIGAADPVSVAGSALFVLAMALVACIVPAWRAGRVDPAEALMAE